MIPRVLKNFNTFLNSTSYIGRSSEVTLPEIKVKTEKWRGGGMDGEVEIDLGLEGMKAKIKFGELLPDVIKLVALADGNAVRFMWKGAMKRDGEAAVPVLAEMHGSFPGMTTDAAKAGDLMQTEFEMAVRYYRLRIGTEDVFEIEPEAMNRTIGGVNQIQDIRDAIGA